MDQDDGHQSTVPFSPTATDGTEIIESSDLSGHNTAYSANVPPRSRPTRLHVPPTSYRPPPSQQHQHQQHQQQDLANMGNPYYSSPQPQAQRQPQQYISQPMSPAMYYPGYHPQSTPPTAYNVNQGYMGPPHTSVGPSMPVTPYAYSHHYAYHGMGGVTATPIPHYPEHDSQQMHPHGANMDLMTGYGAMVASTAPGFGYTIPAYAPTPTAVFTPQYATGPSYQQYNPQQSYSGGYGQSHPGHRPPSLNLSQQQQQPQPQQQASQQQQPQQATPNVPSQVPPSPVGYPNLNQPPSTRGYSPIVTSPSPGLPSSSGFGSLGMSTSVSGVFSVGPSGAGSGTLSGRGTISGYGSSSGDNANRSLNTSVSNVASGQSDSAQGRRPSTYPAERPPSSTHGAATPLTWPTRQEPGQPQVSGKAERSEWVMWVGNVPGDATTEELQTFFSQGLAPKNEGQDGTGGEKPVDSINLSTGSSHNKEESTSTRESEGGVTSVFLISRSNCAFVNYVSEEALNRGVETFNGKPLRSPQVDPRCPKLVCRVRKKGDDVKAGVGGQRGAGMHTRWVKDKAAKSEGRGGDTADAPDRPPLVRGGPAVDISKKSSSGSNVSFASTNSSLLIKNFPVRYFILKSLTQHDLDISVQRSLWATQVHNEDTLEQAYRTSKSVYLIFSVNKSGEFFGYAKMDGPIRQGEPERTPAVEWASRDATTGSNSARNSPVNSRGPPQPTIEEETEGNEQEPATFTVKPENVQPEGKAAVDTQDGTDGIRPLSMPAGWGQRSLDGQPSGTEGKKVPPAQHVSEPAHALQHFTGQEKQMKAGPLQISEPLPPKALASKPDQLGALTPHSASHLFSNILQESPDPLTPGEDRKLHSLENAPQTVRGETKSTIAHGSPRTTKEQTTAAKGGRVSAPAEMKDKHRPLSLSTPSTHPDTWNEGLHSTLWSLEHSIEEEDEGAVKEDRINIPPSTRSLPPESLTSFSAPSEEAKFNPSALAKLASQLAPIKDALIDLVTGSHHPATTDALTAKGPSSPTQDDNSRLPIGGGREEGWGTPFKVKWVRTDPLPFHRTRHLRNPWNHDREVKVSRDGTEIEPTVGQRLIEEWDRTDQSIVATRSGAPPRTPLSPTSPNVPTHIPSRGRGRGRAASGGYSHADIG